MIKTDFLLRIVDKAIVDDVFNNGRKFFEVIPPPGERYSGYSYMCSRATCRRCRSTSRSPHTGSATA
jgi:hypothetical protein